MSLKTVMNPVPDKEFRTGTRVSGYGKDVYRQLSALGEQYLEGGPYLIVSDERIWKAASSRLEAFLAERPDTRIHLLKAEPAPYASDALVAEIRNLLAEGDCKALALGAGTINDVVKRASFELGRPYACLPTAPSVDGFTSSGAAITVGGYKMNLECAVPVFVLADEDILTRAPEELISSGYGDLVAKLAGGADWLIADLLGVQAVVPEVWNTVQPYALDVFGRARALRNRDPEAVGILFDGLARSGLAIQMLKDSRPASGTEHLMSHVWEMTHVEYQGTAASHGFKVGVGTLIAVAFMTELFSPDSAAGRKFRERDGKPAEGLLKTRLDWAGRHFASHPALPVVLATVEKKTPDSGKCAARVSLAWQQWERMGAAVMAQIPDFDLLKERLALAGCPVEPAAIGLDREGCLDSVRMASLIRERYTALDLAAETGVLEICAESVFSSRYFTFAGR